MYQVKILHASQVDILEELINMWLKEQIDVNVVDIKFYSNANENIAILVYQI